MVLKSGYYLEWGLFTFFVYVIMDGFGWFKLNRLQMVTNSSEWEGRRNDRRENSSWRLFWTGVPESKMICFALSLANL